MTPKPHPDTAAYVTLARAVLKMRRDQAAYFQKRREQPHITHRAELRAAQDSERVVDSLVRDALQRERVELPGFGPEGGEAA